MTNLSININLNQQLLNFMYFVCGNKTAFDYEITGNIITQLLYQNERIMSYAVVMTKTFSEHNYQ